ncbi:MAG: leucine-rich repeat domain-containing protein [Peptococcaceae bacterium]|nr:leucine-rich repeat domain-containing protein [Peptococcaceae bacterium]
MKQRKLILPCVLLAVLVLVEMIFLQPIKAEAAVVDSGVCGENLTWTLDDTGTLTVSGTGAMLNFEYYSPSPTKSTHPWKNVASSIKTVVIDDGVTTIGNYAFYCCTNMTSVIFGDSVMSIGSDAFTCCDSLMSFWVSADNLTYSSDTRGVLFNNDKSTLLYAPNGISGSYSIPDSVISIESRSFRGRVNLTSITIPDSVTSIGTDAFFDCVSLQSVTLGINVQSIGESAFSFCGNLSDVIIPASVQNIGHLAFYGCYSLTGIWVDANNPQYSSDNRGILFDKNKTVLIQAPIGICGDYIVPDGVMTISDFAFYECDNLTGVTLPDSLTLIDGYAFYECDNLVSVTIPNSVLAISPYAFAYCRNLQDVIILEGVTRIGNYAFHLCGSLTSITIPRSVTVVGMGAFHQCTGLTSVTIPDSIATIEDYAFNYCYDLENVYYTGTKAQWKTIDIGDNYYLTNANIHYSHVHDYSVNPTTCTDCGYVRVISMEISKVTLRTSSCGLYFKGTFGFNSGVAVSRYGIAVSVYNKLPVADDSDETSLYTPS